MEQMKACVFELNKFHTEVFPVYENLLPDIFPNREIKIDYFVIPRKYRQLKMVYGESLHEIYNSAIYFLCSKTGLRRFYFRFVVNRAIRQYQPDLVIFNSIVPKRCWYVFESIQNRMKFGLIHGFGEVRHRKMKRTHYFVLGEKVFQKHQKQDIDAYLLPFFPQFRLAPESSHDEWVVAIQGNINFKRRNYPLLVETAAELKRRNIQGISFNIIGGLDGRDAYRLIGMVRDKGVMEYFRFHRSLDDKEFFREIANSHYLMPLLGDAQRKYLTHDTITSTYSHSAAYNKPMILSAQNAKIWDIDNRTALIFSDMHGLVELIQNLPKEENYRELCESFNEWKEQRIKENKRLLRKVFNIDV
jgi:hypothetical protein